MPTDGLDREGALREARRKALAGVRDKDYWLVCGETPCWARCWEDAGPEHGRYLELGGKSEDWAGFRADVAEQERLHQRVAVLARHEGCEAPVRREAVPEPFDGEAYRSSVEEWFAGAGAFLSGSCVRLGESTAFSRPASWPSCCSFAEWREWLGCGKYGRGCCSWNEERGCWWYPFPRCSLRTREVVLPHCHGWDWDEEAVRRQWEQLTDRSVTCLDPEGFLRCGPGCVTCTWTQGRLSVEPDLATLGEVA